MDKIVNKLLLFLLFSFIGQIGNCQNKKDSRLVIKEALSLSPIKRIYKDKFVVKKDNSTINWTMKSYFGDTIDIVNANIEILKTKKEDTIVINSSSGPVFITQDNFSCITKGVEKQIDEEHVSIWTKKEVPKDVILVEDVSKYDNYIRVSKPVFSCDGKFAYIVITNVDNGAGKKMGYTTTYGYSTFFVKRKGRWVRFYGNNWLS